jgi:hypothetical protein
MRYAIAILSGIIGSMPLAAADAAAEFEAKVRPILAEHCLKCHSAAKHKGGLTLDTRADALKGGDSGPAIVPGKPAESLLIQAVRQSSDLKMPPKGNLSADAIGTLERWIEHEPPLVAKMDKAAWWSLRPIVRPAVPANHPTAQANPIDAFVLAKLDEKHLAPSPEADRRTLIRRVTFDLTGLPPTPDDVESFIADPDPHCYERLVDRLLASPGYGERWGRHWLDVARYGDTHGYDKDKLRPNAWPYRDWVIGAFNADMPYDRFVRMQLAGDVLFPDDPDGIVATGFIAAGPWDFISHVEVPESKIDGQLARNLDRDEMVTGTLNAFASVTVQCARCHNHKFDPVTQEDYYRLQAVFAAVDRADRPYGSPPKPVFAAATQFKPEGQFKPTGGKPREVRVLRRGEVTQSGKLVGPDALAGVPGVPGHFDLPSDHAEGQRRAALAEWLVDNRNPLTWRSIVNRVWQYHFGRGIVDTPNDFGHMGGLPTHPELLDWLAADFRDSSGSLKRLHRLIITSGTYRQSSAGAKFAAVDADNRYLWRMNRRRLEAEAVRDSVLAVGGRLNRTMGGPAFQDFAIEKAEHSPHYEYQLYDSDDPRGHRRAVYRCIVRSQPQPFLGALDCADPSVSVDRRTETMTAPQALALMNNPFMVAMSRRFAARLESTAPTTVDRVTAAFRLAVSRPPTDAERADLTAYAEKHGLPATCRVIFNLNEFVFVD